RRLAARERNGPGCRHADAQAGEAARTNRHGDALELGELHSGIAHHDGDQRHQSFGMPTQHWQRPHSQAVVAAAVKYHGRTRFERSVDGEDAQGDTVMWGLSGGGVVALKHLPGSARDASIQASLAALLNHTGWTSTTSGTKWRSRFCTPFFRVAVDDGQP